MGNNNFRYINITEAEEILGSDDWSRIHNLLESSGIKFFNFKTFSSIVSRKFERMPPSLCEALFRTMASDINQNVETEALVSILALVKSDFRMAILKFLSRLYENGNGVIEKSRLQELLQLAYGESFSPSITKTLTSLFPGLRREITQREFEQFNGTIDALIEWVIRVLDAIFESGPAKLIAIRRDQTSSIYLPNGISNYKFSPDIYQKLQHMFISHSTDTYRRLLTCDQWLAWVCPEFMSKAAALAYFELPIESYKPSWRFIDFLNFCSTFGFGPVDLRVSSLCKSFLKLGGRLRDRMTAEDVEAVIAHIPLSLNPDFDTFWVAVLSSTVLLLALPANSLFIVDSYGSQNGDVLFGVLKDAKLQKSIAPSILEALDFIQKQTDQCFEMYIKLIVDQYSLFTGLKDLSIMISALFGVPPASPREEKEVITELTLRYLDKYPTSAQVPHGPLGSSWCIISKTWLDSWRLYVGQNFNGSHNKPNSQTTAAYIRPGAVSNWVLLRRHGSVALLPALKEGEELEIIPPAVYDALTSWYGGGPKIVRKVCELPTPSESLTSIFVKDNLLAEDKKQQDRQVVADVELYPVRLLLVRCDSQGGESGLSREHLCSRSSTINELSFEIASELDLDERTVRLWNYANDLWKEQYIISPELTLEQACLKEGQKLLVEASLHDGSWPRALLHSRLIDEEQQRIERLSSTASEDAANKLKEAQSENRRLKLPRNAGLVGLDNLGNTCYLNSSLQALLHTEVLAEYFLKQVYSKHLNMASPFGYQGRLAKLFARTSVDLWTTDKRSLNLRYFFKEVSSLKDQFAGNEQHDAHEFLAFLLDGLSEDLNLVHSKPYTENPDSDNRPDEELAEVWWANHLKRERSLVQTLFSGQFKSVMECSCGYSSARYEPFTTLTVPIPEDFMRVIDVIVVTRSTADSARHSIRVPTRGIVGDIGKELSRIMPLWNPISLIIGELFNGRVRSFVGLEKRLDSIREGEVLIAFEVEGEWRQGDSKLIKGKVTETTHEAHFERPENGENELIAPDGRLSDRNSSTKTFSLRALLESSTKNKSPLVRVAFAQRRVKDGDSSQHSNNHPLLEEFQLECLGVPMVEVLPATVCCADLYRLILSRLRGYYKGSVSHLVRTRMEAQSLLTSSSCTSLQHVQSESDLIFEDRCESGAELRGPKKHSENGQQAVADTATRVSFAFTEDIVAGAIPSAGFTLRLVTGGAGVSGASTCSRCSWLRRCEGCVLPDSNDVFYTFSDGESVSIDWHYLVFEELLDSDKLNLSQIADSIKSTKASEAKVSLYSCLDKFIESEALEGVVCPKCKGNSEVNSRCNEMSTETQKSSMSEETAANKEITGSGATENSSVMMKRDLLWRLPPVLIVQLKRFQFDRVSRRKLNHHVDFPIDSLDMKKYMATPAVGNCDSSCTTYRLYSAVHHLGVLGAGHYVVTTNIRDHTCTSNDSSGWWLFNDNAVTKIAEPSEIIAPSAYILFYVRHDVDGLDLSSFIKSFIPEALFCSDGKNVIIDDSEGVSIQNYDEASDSLGKNMVQTSTSAHLSPAKMNLKRPSVTQKMESIIPLRRLPGKMKSKKVGGDNNEVDGDNNCILS